VPSGASLYLFSDGVFEIVTNEGLEWRLSDFIPHLLQPREPSESQRLFRAVRKLARPGGLDDDFSLLVLTFD
jgi:serine phosphatase RsbU (regulator of sigma subunit)